MNINFTLLGVTQSAHSLYSLRINTQTMSYNVWRQPLTSPLLYCYRLSQISWLINILAFTYSNMISQQLQWNRCY